MLTAHKYYRRIFSRKWGYIFRYYLYLILECYLKYLWRYRYNLFSALLFGPYDVCVIRDLIANYDILISG